MRKFVKLMTDWRFTLTGKEPISVDLPHTWNNIDGQDGGNDYFRGTGVYVKTFAKPELSADELCWLQFDGVNSECEVFLNGEKICAHEGGYSTFRKEITPLLKDSNELTVKVTNAPNDRVYPQKADFTFYGGIYRDVTLVIVPKEHFELDHFGTPGIKVTAKPVEGRKKAHVTVETWHNADEVEITVNGETKRVKDKAEFTINDVRLWNGVVDPYLYTASAKLDSGDEVSTRFGVRDFHYNPKTGFILNGRNYPLHGVSRHQDRKGLGNAITDKEHLEDMDIICEMGANTIRLAHYQHSQYFYDLCDERGMVVWAEIPYISEHMPNGRENTISQMKELITQCYNHASIVCWGVSNEITISTKDNKDMLDNHRVLNDLCHKMDPTRFTTLACYAMCGPFNPVAHITDTVSWNLYLGWYVPGLWLNDVWMNFFHTVYPDRCLGYSEYGCEGMPNLHSEHPHRGDHTEEYQAIYHEYMLRCFERHPWMWATHVWNMFDFAADARDQGGEPGMNHKGLVTFDRKTRKDSFYLYKAYWSDDPFVHICSKRFVDRTGDKIKVKVYSNQNEVSLFIDDDKVDTKVGSHIFEFEVPLTAETNIKVASGNLIDKAVFRKVSVPNESYVLKDAGDKGANWTNKE